MWTLSGTHSGPGLRSARRWMEAVTAALGQLEKLELRWASLVYGNKARGVWKALEEIWPWDQGPD